MNNINLEKSFQDFNEKINNTISIPPMSINTRERIANEKFQENKKNIINKMNSQMNYLIIINDADTKSSFFQKSNEHILYEKYKNIQGDLQLINIKELKENNDIKFKDNNYELHNIYIQNPKTKEYIEISEYNYEYILSKLDEIEDFVRLIGVKSIKTKIYEASENIDWNEFDMKIDISTNINTELGINFIKKYNVKVAMEKEQEYPDNKIIPNEEKILNNKNMFFIYNDEELKRFLFRRTISHILNDKYKYEYYNNKQIINVLNLNLHRFGFKIHNANKCTKSFKIILDVEYYPIPSN